jgi:methanogenic corrinoid protein MtbC1
MERLLRIGPFSELVGVRPERLRNWERRYSLLQPHRSEGGFRLYSSADERRVRAMLRELERGVAAAEAARTAKGATEPAADDEPQPPASVGGALAKKLREALERFDEPAAQALLDEAFGGLGLEAAIRDVVLPCMRELGDRWARGEASVGQEHFASRLIEGRLLGLARGWDRNGASTALLACPSGEQHTLGLIAFGLALSRRGWRVVYLGADTPIQTLRESAAEIEPDAAVLSSTAETNFTAVLSEARALAGQVKLYLAGAGANAKLADAAEAELLSGDAVTAASEVGSPNTDDSSRDG